MIWFIRTGRAVTIRGAGGAIEYRRYPTAAERGWQEGPAKAGARVAPRRGAPAARPAHTQRNGAARRSAAAHARPWTASPEAPRREHSKEGGSSCPAMGRCVRVDWAEERCLRQAPKSITLLPLREDSSMSHVSTVPSTWRWRVQSDSRMTARMCTGRRALRTGPTCEGIC